jgi:hypothetical protein
MACLGYVLLRVHIFKNPLGWSSRGINKNIKEGWNIIWDVKCFVDLNMFCCLIFLWWWIIIQIFLCWKWSIGDLLHGFLELDYETKSIAKIHFCLCRRGDVGAVTSYLCLLMRYCCWGKEIFGLIIKLWLRFRSYYLILWLLETYCLWKSG